MAVEPERQSRGPVVMLVAGIVMTVIGWLVFTIGIFVVVGEGEDGDTTVQSIGAVIVVLSALVGSVGPFLITGGALWWAFGVRARQPRSGASWRSRGPGGINVSG